MRKACLGCLLPSVLLGGNSACVAWLLRCSRADEEPGRADIAAELARWRLEAERNRVQGAV
jgi:hypothetical protein